MTEGGRKQSIEAVPFNGPTFSGRAGAEPLPNHKDRDARPVRCNGWLAAAAAARDGDDEVGSTNLERQRTRVPGRYE